MNNQPTVSKQFMQTLLQPLNSVCYAEFLPTGQLVEANDGFFLMLELANGTPINNLAIHLIHPSLSSLFYQHSHLSDGATAYQGQITFFSRSGKPRTLTGRILRHNNFLCLIAEHDTIENEKLLVSIRILNEELSESQRTLLKVNRQLIAENAELKRALH